MYNNELKELSKKLKIPVDSLKSISLAHNSFENSKDEWVFASSSIKEDVQKIISDFY